MPCFMSGVGSTRDRRLGGGRVTNRQTFDASPTGGVDKPHRRPDPVGFHGADRLVAGAARDPFAHGKLAAALAETAAGREELAPLRRGVAVSACSRSRAHSLSRGCSGRAPDSDRGRRRSCGPSQGKAPCKLRRRPSPPHLHPANPALAGVPRNGLRTAPRRRENPRDLALSASQPPAGTGSTSPSLLVM